MRTGIPSLLLALATTTVAPVAAAPVFLSEPVTIVDGRADYGYGIVVEAGAEPTLTASDLPSWLELSFEPGWTVSTFTGGWLGTGFEDGTRLTARFKNMYGIVLADDGTLYVADTHNHAIREVNGATGDVSTLAGTGSAGFADGVGDAAELFYPQGIALDDGLLYVTDTFNHVIRTVDVDTGEVLTIAGSAGERGFADGDAESSRFAGPRGIALDADGNIYVADSENNAIRLIDAADGSVSTLELDVTLASPRGMEVAGNRLYLADKDNHAVRYLDLDDGDVITLAEGTDVFVHPFDVAVDGQGNVFVPDSTNHRIRRIDGDTGEVTTLAGDGTAGYVEGLADRAQLYFPRSLALADDGSLLIADRSNGAIRRLRQTTAQLLGVATEDELGEHTVSLRATDTDGTSDQDFSIVVEGFNARPEIWGSPLGAAVVGELYRFVPEASDPDDDPLSFEVFQLPGWASFIPSSGQVWGYPDTDDVGLFFHVAVTVNDGTGTDNARTTLPPFNIRVSEPVVPVEPDMDAGSADADRGLDVDAGVDSDADMASDADAIEDTRVEPDADATSEVEVDRSHWDVSPGEVDRDAEDVGPDGAIVVTGGDDDSGCAVAGRAVRIPWWVALLVVLSSRVRRGPAPVERRAPRVRRTEVRGPLRTEVRAPGRAPSAERRAPVSRP